MSESIDHLSTSGCEDPVLLPRWFAAYTASHHEKHVFEELTRHKLEAFLPLYRASRHWKKRTPVTLELPLFPNYVFVRISRRQRIDVLGIPGIFSIVGSPHQAWELPAREIEALRSGLENRKVEPHKYLGVGERVRIKSGPLEGLEGVIARQNNNLRFILSLEQIMQSIAIEVEAEEVEAIHDRIRSPEAFHQQTALRTAGATWQGAYSSIPGHAALGTAM